MSFVTALALAIGVLVVAPYVAHRLRRQQAEERLFAATRLVSPTPPKARRRARLEDRALFGVRAASVVALALLGASPLVQCSRLAMTRSGASVAVAIVLDDSMSMQARTGDARTRFERAKAGATEILAALRDGDAASIVLAGAPARVALAATTDLGSARAALEALVPSDRATDLDGAMAIARTLVSELPQVDRRVVVLSDLADGRPEAPPIGEGAALPVWVAMPELAGVVPDCALLAADRTGNRARVRFACNAPKLGTGREVRLVTGEKGEKVLGSGPVPDAQNGEVTITLPADAPEGGALVIAELTGSDAIASDDKAPVVVEAGPAALAVVSDRRDDSVATGGAPVVEQALAALHVDLATRPIPQPPDRREDTAPFAAIMVDDAPGFTPEQRRALAAFTEGGGMLFLALGPRAAAAPLGANFEPFLANPVGWGTSTSPGADPGSAPLLGESAASLTDLGAKGRTRLAEQDTAAADVLARWTDGAPLFLRRTLGRGEVWLATLPFSVDESDLALRPGFLALLDAFVAEAKQRSAPRRGDVGSTWVFAGARKLEATGPNGPLTPVRDEGALRVVPPVVGAYQLVVEGVKELRVAAPVAAEIDTRPRAVAPSATSSSQGGGVAVVDVSWAIALLLLALLAGELVLRVGAGASTTSAKTAEAGPKSDAA